MAARRHKQRIWTGASTAVFVVTVVMVACIRVMHFYGHFSDRAMNLLIIDGFLGLIILNVVVFTFSLFSGLDRMRWKEKAKGSALDEDEVEREMAPVLQGEKVIIPYGIWVIRLSLAVCLGMIAGSFLGILIGQCLTPYGK